LGVSLAFSTRIVPGKLASVGFQKIEIAPTPFYRTEDVRECFSVQGIDANSSAYQIDGRFFNAFMRAVKPLA